MRIGTGFDIHKLVEGRKLILGGIEIPFEKGLLGHSDADALLHAMADAMLGALSLGDIGKHFPPTDLKWKDADSKIILAKVYEMIKNQGYKIANIDSNIIAEKPKMLEHIPSMKKTISKLLNVDESLISVKARSYEGLDSIGKGDAIACEAVVLLVSCS